MSWRWLLSWSCLALLLWSEARAASLDRQEVPARDREEAILSVDSFGRYAVTAQSQQGVSLQLIDRMAGPGAVSGSPGGADGRLDLFLDRGEYKVVARGHADGAGTAALTAHRFVERSDPARRLIEHKPVSTELADFEQRSWWIQLDARDQVILEAAGRSLADMRLWRDGTWLVEAEPEREIIEPAEGQPMRACRLSADLEPGLYLLTTYGGPEQPWANPGDDADAQPLHLRYGIPSLAEAGRRYREISPFGVDRFRVDGGAELFRLELPAADEIPDTAVSVRSWSDSRPFRADGNRGRITEESNPPVAQVQVAPSSSGHLVAVVGAAGQPYVLQHFDPFSSRPTFEGSGGYWIGTVHAGHAADSIDASAIISQEESRSHSVFADAAIPLDTEQGYARRFNLTESASLLVHVIERADYIVRTGGVDARHRVEPFFVEKPRGYEHPDWVTGEGEWSLDPGYYRVRVEPKEKGVVDLEIAASSLMGSFLDAVGVGQGAAGPSLQASAAWGPIVLQRGTDYTLYLGLQPEVKVGLIQRKTPLDLSDALPLTQRPGQEIEVPARVTEPGVLRAVTETGADLEIAIGEGTWATSPTVLPGDHRVRVRHPGGDTLVYSLWFEPDRLRPDAALPPLPDGALAGIPEFPELAADAPAFLDLDRGQSSIWSLRVDEPALYRVESTGLLATEGAMRTRTVTRFASNSEGGDGRNFLIQSYLREGDYQVAVKTRGRSAGHLGLRLNETPLRDGGELAADVPARIALDSGEGVVYTFEVPVEGEYRIHSFGQQLTSRCRLEDADGWPLVRPGVPADMRQTLDAGRYRLVVLPEDTPSRRITLVERIAQPLSFEGRGPHALPLGRWVHHTWLEPAAPADGGDAERAPDVWAFSLPARADVTISLSEEMHGQVVRADASGAAADGAEPVARLTPGAAWSGALEPGDYRIEALNARRNHGARYGVQVATRQLMAGQSRSIYAPARLEIASGGGLVEIASFGSVDLRAALYSPDGELVARSDDRPEDWNFQIVERLEPGTWTLEVDPVAGGSGEGLIAVTAPEEIPGNAFIGPGYAELVPGRAVHMLPLDLPGSIWVVGASSPESLAAAIEVRDGGDWRTLGSDRGQTTWLALRPDPEAEYRLRLRSLDPRGNPVSVNIASGNPGRMSEAALSGGAGLDAARGAKPAFAASTVRLKGPGLFALKGDTSGLYWCPEPGALCEPPGTGPLAPSDDALWLVRDREVGGSRVQASRQSLTPAAPLRVTLQGDQPATVDIADGLLAAVIADGVAAQPGVRPAEGAEGAWTAGDRRAMAVIASGDAALIWAADGQPDMEANLSVRRFPTPGEAQAELGAWSGAVGMGLARAWALPDGPKQLRLSMGDGGAAMLTGADGQRELVWADSGPSEDLLVGDWTRLTLLNTAPGEIYFSAELLAVPAAEAEAFLAFGVPFERQFDRAGRIRIPVAPEAAHFKPTVHAQGAIREAMWVGADGRVQRLGPDGEGADPGRGGGALVIEHDPGLVAAWVSRPGEEGRALWGQVVADQVIDVAPPDRVALSGEVVHLKVEMPAAGALQVRMPGPAMALVRRGEQTPRVAAIGAGGADLILPAGPSDVLIRAVAGGTLWGVAELVPATATEIGEGLGPQVLIPAGGARLFQFEVTQAGPVGVGVRADSGAVEAAVMDDSGRVVGEGVVQMVDLTPGTWLLALRAPARARPVTARPALAGVEPPDTGPPDDVVRGYLEAAGLSPAEVE